MTTIFLLLLIFFVIIPLVKSAAAIYRARKAARQFFEQFRQQTGAGRAPEPEPQPQKPKKKINADDGEFVQFEDLPPQSDEPHHAETTIVVEQQVVDVEWEDITITK